jgi:hypothetical protein
MVPLKPYLGVSCFWGLHILVGWPRRNPFSGAEKPPIAFICELVGVISASFPTHQQIDRCDHNDGDDDG